MKRILAFCTALLVAVPVLAGNDKAIAPEKLPASARAFIAKYFAEESISLATVDRELLDTTYEVFFIDGNKVEFDKKGAWKEINCRYSRVPEAAIPIEINRQIAVSFPGRYVTEIECEKTGYDLKLENGIELKFSKNFRLIGQDD